MRNIVLSNFETYQIHDVDKCETFYIGEDYFILYNKGSIIKYDEKDGETSSTEIFKLRDSSDTINDASPDPLDITYSFEKSSIFLFLCNGDIIAIELKDGIHSSTEVIGSVSGGVKACKWSPGNELVALVTCEDYVMVMSNEFDIISTNELHGGGFGEKQFETVGWGKKETQFRGSEGKYKTPCNTTEFKNDFGTDKSVRISWRGDAEYFVVSSINPGTQERYLRIFSKEGILQYTSENINGLEHSLDWRPSGNLIASTQRLQNKHNVCFFEKNGLKHGEFTLPFKQNEVIVQELMWNQDSKLLALLIEKIYDETHLNQISNGIEKGEESEKLIFIYCVNNYHWYCKYSIPVLGNYKVVMQWDQKINNLLHVFTNKGNQLCHNKYTWMWTVNKSRGKSEEDQAFVAVIDGTKLLITSFKKGILPPPLCSYTLEMCSQINQVGFAPDCKDSDISSNDLFVQLSNGKIYFYKFECNEDKIMHHLLGMLDYGTTFIYSIHWVLPKIIAFCEKTFDSPKYYLSVMNILNFEMNITFNVKKYPIVSSIALLRSINADILFHDNTGSTYLFVTDNKQFTELCPKPKRMFIELEVIQKNDKSLIIYGLDKSNKFFINDNMIANNITSFHIHQEFLLLTNLKHKLLCLPTEAESDKMMEAEMNEISSRRVEKGSRLIVSIQSGTKVILQMPRGNLECIQPRALSFSVIGKYLDELQYYKAFDIMRLQRINLNLLYDHNPDLFKANVELFIEQIKDPTWISLFLSELVDEDVTAGMYSVIYKKMKTRPSKIVKSKTVVVCELLEKTLEREKYSDKYVLPILTTYMKRGGTYYLECALKKLKHLKESENKGIQLTVTFDEAFKYILYLIDVEELYKVALGMYDFDLVLLVATKSQKDPKEYLPFLNDLKKLEVNYQKFVINRYLKRYEKALEHLLQCGDNGHFTECLNFIKVHKLYKTAMKLVPHTTDRYKQICSCFADELLKSHFYEEAGIMFSNSGSYSNAIAAFTKSGNWQEAISCSTRLKLTSNEINKLYENLAKELIERKKFQEASIVYMDYLKNTEMGLTALCHGKMYGEAFRVAELSLRDDLIQAQIKPSILDSYKATKLQISTFSELFTTQKNRLCVVRENKLLRNKDGDVYGKMNDEDTCSDSSTIITQSYAGSRTTNRTFRSAKNKRKQERKLLSLKEGSPYEDLALIASLHNIVSNCLELRNDVRELNRSLIKINQEELAEELQKSLETVLRDIEDSKAEIWTPDLLNRRQIYGPETTSNSIAASFMESDEISPSHLINPRLLIPPEVQPSSRWQLEILNV